MALFRWVTCEHIKKKEKRDKKGSDWPVLDDVSAVAGLLFPLCAVCIFTQIGRHRSLRFPCHGKPLATPSFFSRWPPRLTMSSRRQCLRGADSGSTSAIISNIEHTNVDSSQLVRVYPSVSPHMGLFLAAENCVVLHFCARARGWDYRGEPGEERNTASGWAEQNILHDTRHVTSVCLLQGGHQSDNISSGPAYRESVS